mgnify:CR=1 FL=1
MPISEAATVKRSLPSSSEVEIADAFEIEGAVCIVTQDAKIYIPMGELVDKDKELARLNDEKKKLEGEIKRVEGKLSNEGFVAKAPQKVIDEEKEKATERWPFLGTKKKENLKI